MTHNAIAQASEGYQTLVAAEAYVDDHQLSTDLDLNNVIANGFSATSGLIDIADLSRGAHTLYLRMQDETGEWSKPIGQNFYIANEGQNTGQGQHNHLQQAELYFDTDPGEGQGISITVPEDGLFNQSYEQFIGHELLKNISSGLHTVYVRVKDANGLWSVAIGQSVSVDNSGFSGDATGSNYKLKAAEAYFDIDPGLGDGLAILNTETQEVGVNAEVLKGLIDIAQLTDGIHTLYIRYQNQAGLWSQSLAQSVFITPDLVDNNISSGVATILSAEYALDGGVFQLAPLADGESGGLVEEINFTIPVTLAGYHSVEVRFTDSKGRTSQDSTQITATANDQDWDGLPDAWEKQYLGGTGYSINDDPDNDGLSNGQEYLKGTDPLVKDETGIQTISGFVTDVDGKAIADLAICIEINVSTTQCHIKTDALGHYVLGKDQALVPATYRVYPKSDTTTASYGYNPVSRSVGLDLISVSQINFVAEPLAISLSSPTTSTTYQAAQSVTLNWQGNGRTDMPVTLFMKRDSVANSQTEANTNDPDWHVFTASTDNDGSETVTLPKGLTVADNWRFYVGFTGTTVQGPSANNFSYEELVINFPIAEIISYEPQEPIEGEVLTLTGKVTAEGQSIVQHYWGVIPLQDGQEIGDETQIGSAAILSTQELAAGEWRFVYQVRNDEGLASESAVLDLEVLSAEGLADLAIDRAGIRMLDQDGNPVVQVETGDLVTLKVAVHNKGRAAMQDFALLSVYDDMPETGVLLTTGNVRQLAAGETQELEILWTVPEKQGYQALVFNLDFEQNLRSEQTEVFESNRQNNLVSAFLIIGTPPPGSYGINMTMSHQVPSPYAVYSGDRLTITGDAHYMWGSRLPVMGAVLTVTMQGKTVPAGYTMSPTGRYSISVQAPKELGEYKIEVKVFDSNLYAQKEITIDVRERPIVVVPPPQPQFCQIVYCPVIPTPAPVAKIEINDIYYTGAGVYTTDSGIDAASLGSTIDITAQIKNVGNLVSTQEFSLRFYAVASETGEVQIGDTIIHTDNLSGSGVVNYVATEPLNLDSLGQHSIYATVTANEGGESTRVLSVDVRESRPDLRPYQGISFSSRPIAGETINVNLDVLNRGPADLNQPFEVSFYNGDPRNSSSASLIGKDYVSANLAKGEVVHTSIPLATQQAGDFAIFALIDYDNDIEEDVEHNNVASNILHVCPATIEQSIGLQVSNSYPGVKSGLTLTATVANRCGLASPADSVSFYNGDPDNGGLLIGSQAISQLAGSASTRVSMPWQTPETAGAITLYARLNNANLIAKYTIYVTETPIPTPNLQVYSADIVRDSLSVELNQQVQLSAYIRNVSKEQEASGFSVNFYVDSLTKFTQIGETIVINQALATESQILVQATARFTADEPYYAILVEVIPNIEQGDSNFSDNKATTSFAVKGFEFINRPPVASDLVIETLKNKAVKIDVLQGVSDPENEVVNLWAVNTTSIKHGKATFDSTGVITYTPATNATDDVEFTYHLQDASGQETIKKISVKVRDVEISTELRQWPITPAGLVNSDSLLVELNCKTDVKDKKGNLTITKYQWDFGDGKTKTVECGNNCSADSFVQHRYETRGRYKASCTAVTAFDVTQSHDEKHVLYMPIDTDLDALPDAWEEFGFCIENDCVDLKEEGALVGQRDLFLWIDHMYKGETNLLGNWKVIKNFAPNEAIIGKKSDIDLCFNQARDPDTNHYANNIYTMDCYNSLGMISGESLLLAFARRGIALHVDYGGQKHRVEYGKEGYISESELLKESLEKYKRPKSSNNTFSVAKEHIYRYLLFVDQIEGADGLALISFDYPNNYSAITVRGVNESNKVPYTAISVRATVMHELGHSLGLGHGNPILGGEISLCIDDPIITDCLARLKLNSDIYEKVCGIKNDTDCMKVLEKPIKFKSLCYENKETLWLCYERIKNANSVISFARDKDEHEIGSFIDIEAQTNMAYKPNYLSIMGYLYLQNGEGLSYIDNKTIKQGLLDFSIFELNTLFETSLDEAKGVFGAALIDKKTENGDAKDKDFLYFLPYETSINDYAVFFRTLVDKKVTVIDRFYVDEMFVSWNTVNSPIDWNNNEWQLDSGISAEITGNEDFKILKTYSDWDNLVFGGFKIGCEIRNPVYSNTKDDCIVEPTPKENANVNNLNVKTQRYFSSYNFTVIPFDQNISGLQSRAGKQVILSMILVNMGLKNDSYELSVKTSSGWDALIMPISNVKSGHRKVVQVLVTIPEGVAIDHEEEILVSMHSQGNPLLSADHTFFIDTIESEDLDSDNDSLSDSQELVIGLDPNNPDTDGDGVSDGVEVLNPLDPLDRNNNGIIDALDGTDIYPLDSDDDGIGDDKETALGLDPFNPDTDDDGINDGLEAFVPRADDQAIDFDGDGQIDALEAGNDAYEKAAALPGDFDSDGDVDLDDLTLMRAYFGQPASGPDDPADLNNDGVINVLDYRLVARLCTRYRCATQ